MMASHQQQLLQDTDELRVKCCEDDWKGHVPFQCLPVHRHDVKKPLPASFPAEFVKNICNCLGPSQNKDRAPETTGMHRLCLDPSMCPHPPSAGKDPGENESPLQIKTDLQSAANNSGSPMICNGGGPLACQFQCKFCNKVYNSKPDSPKKPDDCCQDAPINTCKGCMRKDGQSEAKRVRAKKSVSCSLVGQAGNIADNQLSCASVGRAGNFDAFDFGTPGSSKNKSSPSQRSQGWCLKRLRFSSFRCHPGPVVA
jgi:hypothetical protein